jgi:predicted dehydrogenase
MAGTTGVALVGAGYWGSRLARVLAASGGCRLIAVCDIDAVRAHEVADKYGAVRTTSWMAAVTHDAVDAIVVATPATTHAALVTAALDASRHALVAKPLSCSSLDAARLGARADDLGLVLMCDQTYRFAPALTPIRKLLADPAFGRLQLVESQRINCGHDQPDVDVFWDLAFHDLTILDVLAPSGLRGRFEVQATLHDVARRGRLHRGHLTLEASTGWCARITVDWHADAKVRTLRLASADHEITWDDADLPLVHRDGVPVPVESGEPLAAVATEFLTAIDCSRPASCGPAHEVRILRVLEAATESAAHEGAPVVVEVSAEAATSTVG